MGYKSTIEIPRTEALKVIEQINMNNICNEGLAEVMEVLNDWHTSNRGIGYYNYIVKD